MNEKIPAGPKSPPMCKIVMQAQGMRVYECRECGDGPCKFPVGQSRTSQAPAQSQGAVVEERTLASLVEGLHALLFGIASLKDPALALMSLEDGGQIHEYAHTMIRLLPSITFKSLPPDDMTHDPEPIA